MNGPILSFDINRSNKVDNTKTNNNLVRVYFSNHNKPILTVIKSCLSTNSIKVYQCLKTNTYAVIKIENNRMYRLIGPKLIGILINNIDSNWQLICSYKNMDNFDIKRLYLEYNIK